MIQWFLICLLIAFVLGGLYAIARWFWKRLTENYVPSSGGYFSQYQIEKERQRQQEEANK